MLIGLKCRSIMEFEKLIRGLEKHKDEAHCFTAITTNPPLTEVKTKKMKSKVSHKIKKPSKPKKMKFISLECFYCASLYFTYEAFHVNCPSAARERQIVLYLAHVYNTKMYLKKFYEKHFRRIFSSAFQWCRQFSRNFPFSPSESTKRDIS